MMKQSRKACYLRSTMSTLQMPRLNLPEMPVKVRMEGDRKQIWDPTRKRFVVLSPEEWVRQHFVHYLIRKKRVPASLIAVEMGFKLNGMQKRSDLVIHTRMGVPWLIVECKASDVKINQAVFDQIARYNMALQVAYLVVTNGMEHYCCKMDHANESWNFIPDIPAFG